MKKVRTVAAALLAVGLIGAASFFFSERSAYRTNVFAMDTFIDICFYGRRSQEAAVALTQRLKTSERLISMYVEGSDIRRLSDASGNGEPVSMEEESFVLLEKAKAFSEGSRRAFDPTVAPLTRLWGISSGETHIPDPEDIQNILPLVNVEDLILDSSARTARLRQPGQAVDLGGIAKGAATDTVLDVMDDYQIKNGFVSIGGNMVVRGKNPVQGKDFIFGVRDPRGSGEEYIGTLPLAGLTMATSGDYERYFESDGVRYHHILDPRTGYPAESGLISVSVISPDGALADFLSTALFVLGKETALTCMDDARFLLILVDAQNNVYVSRSLDGVFVPNPEHTQYRFTFL